jgi:uncharacterized protein
MSNAMADDQVRGRTGWIISDGKMGNDVQTRGVFDALGLDYQVKRIEPTKLQAWLAPYARVGRGNGFKAPGGPFTAPWPDFVISIGRLTTPYMRAMRGHAGFGTYRIILQDPKVSLKTADLFWVPEHDRRRGPNVITTLTPPHSFSARRIADLRRTMPPEIAALPSPRVAVLLGGPHGTYTYSSDALAELVSALTSLASLGCGLMITPSRRTPQDFTAALAIATRHLPRFFWDFTGDNPYPHFLAHADAFIVPADSVNMTGEPSATGKPIYVFSPGGGGSPKFNRFHDAMRRAGVTRPMPARFERLETWTYRPTNTAEAIAAEINKRWTQRRTMLGNGTRT